MKLQDALRKVIRQLGVGIIQEKRLMSFLADYKAFDDYPAVKEVMRAIATGGTGRSCAASRLRRAMTITCASLKASRRLS